MTHVDVSVVVPVYGCAGCLESLVERTARALDGRGETFEIVLVDDRSTDGSWQVARELAAGRPWLRTLRLSRNFGQHAAVTAGLANAGGEHIVVMDCDLQDPPEAIPQLLAKAREGYDVVLARRGRRPDSARKRLVKRAYYRLVRLFGRVDVDPGVGNFSAISRKVADAFLQVGELNRQYLLIVYWLGFDRAIVDVKGDDRHEGSSSYSLRQLVQVALDGLFFHTTLLLGWIVVAGLAVAALALLFAAAIVVANLLGADQPVGYASLATITLFLGGAILASIGLTAMYAGRIFEQVKGRPLYVVDEEQDGQVGDEGLAAAQPERRTGPR